MASNTEALSLPALAALRSLQPISLEAQNSVFDLKRGNVWSKLDSLKREPG